MREGIRLLLATAVVVASAAFVAAPVAGARAQHPVTGPHPPGGGAAAPDGEGGSLRATTVWAARSCARSGWRRTRSCRARPRGSRCGSRPGSRALRARVVELRRGNGKVVRVSLGRIRAGRAVRVRWAGTDALAPGNYVAHLARRGPVRRHRPRGADRAPCSPPGRRPGAAAPAHAGAGARPGPGAHAAAPTGDTAFPVAGPHDYGGPDSRFGAGRAGHIHQGQDVAAAEGTPLVAPAAGHDHHGRLPGRRRRLLRGRGRRRRHALVRRSCTSRRARRRSPRASRSASASAWRSSARPATRPGRTCTSRSGSARWQDGGHPVDPLPLLKSWDHQPVASLAPGRDSSVGRAHD